MSAERLQRIDARIQDYLEADQIAGAVTLVARQGKVVHLKAHGFRDRESGDAMEVDDMFVMMSMTKPIVSTALMMLYEEGKFLLSDPISNWLPEFTGVQVAVDDGQGAARLEPAEPITIRHVLTHTSGIAVGRGAPALSSAVAGFEGALASPATVPHAGDSPVRASVREMAATPLNFQPGTRWQYGSSTDVVAALAEVISGQTMDAFLRERIFEPLGMHDTHYNVPAAKWDRRARVYVPDRQADGVISPRPVTEPAPTDFFGGVAGLTSTVPDYFRFAQMVMNGGEYDGVRLLSPMTVDLMITNHIADGLDVYIKGPGYGFGLGYSVLMDPALAEEPLTPGSYGWGGAWGTYYINDPAEELIAILLIQITSYGHLNIRPDMATLATQSIIESNRAGPGRVMGRRRID
jgi:CubicO group peptidase (beta-lactamase class C family)